MRRMFLFLLALPCFLKAQKVVVGLPAMNVLYVGLDNEVKIAVEGYKTRKLVKQFTGGDMVEKEGKLYLRVYKPGEARLRVGIRKKKDTLWADSMLFRIRKIVLPLPQLGTLQHGSVESAATIRANASRVYMGLQSCWAINEYPKFTIERFTLTIIDSSGFETFQCTGNTVPPAATAYISQLKPGGKIIITNAYHTCYDENGLFYQNEPLPGNFEVSVRPGASNFSITGSFTDTNAVMHFYSHRYNSNNFTAFAGKTKHGEWNYYTGTCPARLWCKEIYDSGRLVLHKVWNNKGGVAIDGYRPELDGPLFLKVFYPGGQPCRMGWVNTELNTYVFWGETGKRPEDNINPALQPYKTLRFIPAGDWKEYHPNGKLKLTGNFTTVPYNDKGDYDYIEDKQLLPKFAVVADGKWAEYDENGHLIKEYRYDKGVLVQ